MDHIRVKFDLGMENGLDITLMFNICGHNIFDTG